MRPPRRFLDGLVAKGSVALDGVSLTVAEVVRDRFSVALVPTTLAETTDRVMATEVTAQWWHAEDPADWNAAHSSVLGAMTSAFAGHHSLALPQGRTRAFEIGA